MLTETGARSGEDDFVSLLAPSCNQCYYASSQVGDLRGHLKSHSGEKSNKCNECDYASFQAGNLNKHLKTHSGEKSIDQVNATKCLSGKTCLLKLQVVTIEVGYTCQCSLSIFICRLVNVVVIGV